MNPLICFSDLTKRWYVVIRYKQLDDKGNIRAITKYDVTEQIEMIQKGLLPKI
jgi:hypothetical protein